MKSKVIEEHKLWDKIDKYFWTLAAFFRKSTGVRASIDLVLDKKPHLKKAIQAVTEDADTAAQEVFSVMEKHKKILLGRISDTGADKDEQEFLLDLFEIIISRGLEKNIRNRRAVDVTPFLFEKHIQIPISRITEEQWKQLSPQEPPPNFRFIGKPTQQFHHSLEVKKNLGSVSTDKTRDADIDELVTEHAYSVQVGEHQFPIRKDMSYLSKGECTVVRWNPKNIGGFTKACTRAFEDKNLLVVHLKPTELIDTKLSCSDDLLLSDFNIPTGIVALADRVMYTLPNETGTLILKNKHGRVGKIRSRKRNDRRFMTQRQRLERDRLICERFKKSYS